MLHCLKQPRSKTLVIFLKQYRFADMAELADAPDLGSGVHDVQVQVLLSAPDNDNPNPVPIGDGFGFLVYL